MRIHIGKTDYEKDNIYIKVNLKYNEKELSKKVHLKGNKDFNETWDWKFEKNEYKYLFKKCLELELERSYWYKFGGTSVIGSAKIDLKNLKDSAQLVGDYKLELVSKGTTPSINVTITLRTPFVEKQYETLTKEVIKIKRIYPPFNPKDASVPGLGRSTNIGLNITISFVPPKNIINIITNSNIQNKEKIEKEKEMKPKKEEIINNNKVEGNKNAKEENNKSQNNAPTNVPVHKIDKSLFKEEELADVDGVDYINSLKVLEYELKLLEYKISKISGRTPRELLQKKVKISLQN